MTQVLPVTNYPEQTLRLTLDGIALTMRVYWSEFDSVTKEVIGDDIDGQWYMDFATADGSISMAGMAIVGGCDMLEPYAFDGLGSLWAIDVEGKPRDMTLASLGTTHQLIYVPVAEVEQFSADIGWAR